MISNIDQVKISNVGVLNDVISDHYPVYMCIKKERNRAEHKKIKGRTYKKYDKTFFQQLVIHENWYTFYDLSNPTELWNYIV